ncbi:D-allose transporter substrate-binding protein [Vibrio panuliri]|uniref:Autoinducer 2-binding periplasmic protein LuxP n=1 Tax=Vibrio panuliri TaxID=1381081 RepID=A0ABX3FDP3_9VIBR|nr:D-allose transporter substrate-binding protein [Vibrio panuliri]KAB1457129.1 D-allose transporter substrate-binding protein [Vibrio panuliri]OLQ87620.1 allose ABC transporter [Vibrio panuliri]
MKKILKSSSLALALGIFANSALATDYAVILKTLNNPFWVEMKEGIEKYAQENNIDVDIYAAASEGDMQSQMRLFEDVTNRDYKGIAFAPLSANNLVFPAVKAYKKGIHLVNLDERVDIEGMNKSGAQVAGFVTTDNVAVGATGATYIIEQLGAEGGKVAIVEGKAGNASGEARRSGAQKTFDATKNIKLVASQPADWDRMKALDVATNILQRNPDLKAFYCANDTMAMGVAQAVRNAGKTDSILVVGTDGAPEARKMVQDGQMSATVAQDPAQIGVEGMKILIQSVDGGDLITIDTPPKTAMVPAVLID